MRTIRRTKAFTLIEILIVVVILGILAAIVIPQFTRASQEAQTGNVATQLQTIRSQIELYRIRNNGNYPPSLDTGTFDDFLTPPAGQEPYLRSAPRNPRNNSDLISAGIDTNATSTNGWYWDAATSVFGATRFDEELGQWVDDPAYAGTGVNAGATGAAANP